LSATLDGMEDPAVVWHFNRMHLGDDGTDDLHEKCRLVLGNFRRQADW